MLEELDRFHREVTSTGKPNSLLKAWRRLIDQRKASLGAFASAVKDVIEARQISVSESEWKNIYDFAEHAKKDSSPPSRTLRSRAAIVALWGKSLVDYYSLLTLPSKQLEFVRTCAAKDPYFRIFPRIADAVMLRRHEHSFFQNKTPSIAEGLFPLARSDLEIIASLMTGKTKFDDTHERRLTLASAMDRAQTSRVKEWVACQDGAVSIRHSQLRGLRPDHFEQYLLRRDSYGMLILIDEDEAERLRRRRRQTEELPAKDMNGKGALQTGLLLNDPITKTVPTSIKPSITASQVAKSMPSPSSSARPSPPPSPSPSASASPSPSLSTSPSLSIVDSEEQAQNKTPGRDKDVTQGKAQDQPFDGAMTRDLEKQLPGQLDQPTMMHWNHQSAQIASSTSNITLTYWLPLTFASVRKPAELSDLVSSSGDSIEDVMEITSVMFKEICSKNYEFRTPMIIKESFPDTGDFNCAAYASLIDSYFPDGFINVRKNNGRPTATPTADVVSWMESPDKAPFGANLLDLEGVSNAVKPALTRIDRFRALDRLDQRLKAEHTGQYGKKSTLTPYDIGSSQSFEIFGFKGAFSGGHVDVLGGTWLRNLFGVKLWIVVPEHLMTADDWADFSMKGSDWNPRGKGRAIVLRPGDVFFMPPGIRVIHAVLTLETSLMSGGMVWDEQSLIPTLENLLWVCKNPQATNEPMPFQLASALDWLDNRTPRSIHPRCCHTKLREAVSELRRLGCTCEDQCSAGCPCAAGGVRCTPLCTNHILEVPDDADSDSTDFNDIDPDDTPRQSYKRACLDDPMMMVKKRQASGDDSDDEYLPADEHNGIVRKRARRSGLSGKS